MRSWPVPIMRKQQKETIFTGILPEALAASLGEAIQSSGHRLTPVKNIKKLHKLLEKHNIDAVILDESSLDIDIMEAAKTVSTDCPDSKIIIILDGPCSTQSELFQFEEIDHIVPRGPNIDDTLMRIARSLGIRVLPASEGKTRILCEKLFETTSAWSSFGNAFDIYEGIRLHHPHSQLKSQRSDDREVAFLKNGQLNPYCIQGIPYFWMPDTDACLNHPPEDILLSPKKLIVHATAPPIHAAIEREQWYIGYSHFIFTPKSPNVSIEEACSLLNSRVFDFYINKIFTPVNMSGKARSIMRSMDWRDLPFPKKLLEKHDNLFEEELLEMELLLKSGAGFKHPRVAELHEQFNQWAFECFEFDEDSIKLLSDLHF